MKNELRKLDELIENDFKLNGQSYLQRMSHLIQEMEQIEIIDKYESFLFSQENERRLQRFISFCFIRILESKNIKHLESSIYQIYKLIISSLPDVCNILKVDEKTPNYKKEQILRDFIREREEDFNDRLTFNGEKSELSAFQQNYRRACNDKKNSILHFFVGSLLNKSTLDKLFNRLNDYSESSEENKYNAYIELENAIVEQIEDAEEISTRYAKDYISKPFSKVKEILSKDIEKSPYYRPAILEVFKTEKKYPFQTGVISKFNIGIRNKGTGYAQNVRIKINGFNDKEILITETSQSIGNVKFEDTIVEFEYEVLSDVESIILGVELIWGSASHKNSNSSKIIELNSQSTSLDWDIIKQKEPYNLEPVEHEVELIGRDNILQKLRNMMTIPLSSSYIYGQRRVGKTSIVKTFLNSNKTPNLLILYIEAGDWNDANDAKNSMNNLGIKICRKIKRENPKFNSLPIPDFQGSFNNISDFLEEVQLLDPGFNCLIILDEFDRISRKLYERGDIGQSFVLTLRSISNRPQFGFILVGGEKLEYILSQWQEFNKFISIRVDYFSKERDYDDFGKLIRRPVNGILEISNSAIDTIYTETSGNPYFTKKICMELFILMVTKRDIHVTYMEANDASVIARSAANIGATDFSHFWEDGIKGKVEKEEETSLKRRKLLIAMTTLLCTNKKLLKDSIIDRGYEIGLKPSEVEKYLLEFEHRKIIQSIGNEYDFVVKFFKEWLKTSGLEKIVATFEEEERVMINEQLEIKAKIKTEEIAELIPNLKIYKGKEITTDNIRFWLNQFEDVFDQRIIFKILQNFKLYSEIEIRQKLEYLYTFIRKEFKATGKVRIISQQKSGNIKTPVVQKKKRDDIIVSYLDNNPAKGGSYFIKLFADVNSIYSDNTCNPNLLEKQVNEKTDINGLVIIDDFIGSGGTTLSNIDNYFTSSFCNTLRNKEISVIFGAIAGFSVAKELIIQKLEKLNISAKVMIIDILNDSDKCFSDSSMLFSTLTEKKRAESICKKIGELLEPKFPLGYSNCQLTIAFPMNCPNNTLPIFWKKTANWEPLFRRN